MTGGQRGPWGDQHCGAIVPRAVDLPGKTEDRAFRGSTRQKRDKGKRKTIKQDTKDHRRNMPCLIRKGNR